jgi:outer membrane immunogenic protein
MKRILIALALSTAAMGAAQAASEFDGAYAGAEAGYAGGQADVQFESLDDDFSSDGAVGGAFAGFGKTYGNVYVGAEANVSYSGVEADIDGTGAEVSKGVAFGGAARVGYLVRKDTMVVGKVGYEAAEFEIGGDGESEKKYLNGLVVGVGAEHNLGDGIGVRGTVDYTTYEDKNIDGVKVGGDEVSGKAGVVFRF